MARKLSFLAASDGTRLAKHYALSDGVLDKLSYPHVFYFDSHTESVRSLADFAHIVAEHAAQGHCLLKGELQRPKGEPQKPLRHESRSKQTTTATPTDWICLDFDGIPGVTSFEDLLPQLPAYFKDVGYVEQFSASAGIEPDKGYSAHVFMLLGEAVPAPQLKEWLIHLNLSIPILRSHIQLNKAKTVLRWPLDITACQNDKLIYVAPPNLAEGIVDGFEGERIRYMRRREATLSIPFALVNPEHNRAESFALRDELLVAEGLPAQSHRLSKGDILRNVTATETSNEKHERDFCYVNINGGDSWGYYHPDTKPEILYNFKGEPNYLIKDLLPDYYERAVELATALKEIRAKAKRDEKKQAKREEKIEQIERAEETARETGIHYVAANDPALDSYCQITYNANTEELKVDYTKSRQKVIDFLMENGEPVPDFISNWQVVYDFDSGMVFDRETKYANQYKRSEYLKNSVASDTVPPLTATLLDHVLGHDQACVERFLNWLACIVQHRTVTMSAWVISGEEGTGKGALFHHVLTPLLGTNHTYEVQLADFQTDFNEFMERCQLIFIDESQSSDLRQRAKVMSNLKHLIAEKEISIHKKHCSRRKVTNRANFIIASNKYDPVDVDRGNRRYNVAPRQEVKLLVQDGGPMTSEQIEHGLKSELYAFAGYLLKRAADAGLAKTPIQTAELDRLKELSSNTCETIAYNLKKGNLAYFVESWPDDSNPAIFKAATGVNNALTYEQLLDEFFANTSKPMNVPIKMAHALFYYLTGLEQHPTKFISHMRNLGFNPKKVNYKDKAPNGLYGIPWHATPELIAEWQQERALRALPQKLPLRSVK